MYFESHKQPAPAATDQEILDFSNVMEAKAKFKTIESSHKDQKLGPESL